MTVLDWAGRSGDSWADRWRDTDRGLAALGAELDSELIKAAPAGPFRAFDVGCGPGTTSLNLARARPDAEVVGCDLSAALVDVARARAATIPRARFIVGNAEEVASAEDPFDVIFSRHGVMFFPDPVRAFRKLREAAAPNGALVFSCFRDWSLNPWASQLASAVAGATVPPPGREPSGFAFADPGYVGGILGTTGWTNAECRPVDFIYAAGEGESAVDDALAFLTEIGPASAVLRDLPQGEASTAIERMRHVIERYRREGSVEFPAAAWIWTARAAGRDASDA